MASPHKIVSSEAEELILVDSQDREIGYLAKSECHNGGGILHRAFSVFLFDNQGRLLLQRRARGKRLWPGYWSNSCCSHPRRGETMQVATRRRLRDELNISSELRFVYKFEYQADFGALGAEHELCHVYLGKVTGDVRANENEIDALAYLNAVEVEQALLLRPDEFTPWFKMEWQTLRGEHAGMLDEYLSPGH
ncbi:MAG TPA: isopentenyl-diphosphate Delta-isomerase [Woeseiaceae bacterium]|nr:isopentenyl-diphosphate Delta-isomerase [Woeseiaceae bacterium]